MNGRDDPNGGDSGGTGPEGERPDEDGPNGPRNRPADMEVEPTHRGFRRLIAGLSAVWLVPLAALVVALAIAWQEFATRGPLIEIAFGQAGGVVAGETVLRFRDVEVGEVEAVTFSDDLGEVLVSVRLAQEIASYVDADARFWIVEPELSARGVTGLDTVISGVYLQGLWDPEPGEPQRQFQGLSGPPLNSDNRPGLQITLRAASGGRLSAGAPVLFKGIEVGRIDTPELNPSGAEVTASAFIEAPYDRLVTTATAFWAASGFSLSVGASGVSLDVASLAALVEGGVSFGTVLAGGEPVEPGTIFDVRADMEEARTAIFEGEGGGDVTLSMVFDGSISGLSVGAPVEFQGLGVGTVTDMNAFVVDGTPGRRQVRMRVDAALDSDRLGLDPPADTGAALDFLGRAVDAGLRARLASQNLFGTTLKVEMVEIADVEPAALDRDADPFPVLPTAPADQGDAAATAQTALERLSQLPIEGLLLAATDALSNFDRLLASPELQQTPEAVLGLLRDARGVVGGDELATLTEEASATAAELRQVATRLNNAAAIDAFVAALARSDDIARALEGSVDGLPELIGEIEKVASVVNQLPVDGLVSAATGLVEMTTGILGSDEASQLPKALTDALNELTATLQALREGGAVNSVNETLSSTSAAAAEVERAAASLPDLATRIGRLAAQTTATLGTYDNRSDFNSQALGAIRDLREVSKALTDLARTIERNPNSLILGR